MTTGQKIAKLRREQNMTQDALADALGVSRQAVSKWESDAAFPETEKLVRLSRLFGCSVDYILKEEASDEERQGGRESAANRHGGEISQCIPPLIRLRCIEYEYKSARTLFGMPLVHINLGWGRTAKGVVAVGFKARGIVSVGFLSMGVLSLGCLSLGVLSLGALALGLVSLGAVAVGILLALGAVAVGFVAYGAFSVGFFAAGAFAAAKYVAVGDYAFAAIPIGRTVSSGGVLYDFYFSYADFPSVQVGYFENGAFIEAQSIPSRACEEYVPEIFRWLARLFVQIRLYP